MTNQHDDGAQRGLEAFKAMEAVNKEIEGISEQVLEMSSDWKKWDGAIVGACSARALAHLQNVIDEYHDLNGDDEPR